MSSDDLKDFDESDFTNKMLDIYKAGGIYGENLDNFVEALAVNLINAGLTPDEPDATSTNLEYLGKIKTAL